MFRRFTKVPAYYLLIGLLVVLMTPFLIGFSSPRRVTIKYDNKVKEVSTNFYSARAILEEADIKLEPCDSWKFEEGHKGLQDGCILEVIRGTEFQVVYNGQTKKFKSSKATVSEALKNVGVQHKGEKIYPAGHTQLHAGMTVYVLDKHEQLHLQDTEGELPVTFVDDKDLAAGAEVVVKPGKAAKVKIISKSVKHADGSQTVTELGRVEIEPAENKVVRRGTALSIITPNGYKRYSKKLICEATAYYEPGGITASGTRARYGAIATDPRYIPLGTSLYIPGYGLAVAEDTGGAIKGNIIDLHLNSYAQCIQWGRRNVEVYILED